MILHRRRFLTGAQSSVVVIVLILLSSNAFLKSREEIRNLGVCQILRREGGGVYYPPCLLLRPTDLVIVDFDLVEDSVLDEAVEHRAVDLAEELPGVQFIL